MMMVRTVKPFADAQIQRAGLRIEVDVADVRRHLAAVADALVVVIDLEHVRTERVAIKDLADRKIHQREQRIVRHALVAGEADLRDQRILDHAIGDRHAVGTRTHERRCNRREIPERIDALEVGLHDLGIVGHARTCLDDLHDRRRRDVEVPRDVDRDDLRHTTRHALRAGRGRRNDRERDDESQHGSRTAHQSAWRAPKVEDHANCVVLAVGMEADEGQQSSGPWFALAPIGPCLRINAGLLPIKSLERECKALLPCEWLTDGDAIVRDRAGGRNLEHSLRSIFKKEG